MDGSIIVGVAKDNDLTIHKNEKKRKTDTVDKKAAKKRKVAAVVMTEEEVEQNKSSDDENTEYVLKINGKAGAKLDKDDKPESKHLHTSGLFSFLLNQIRRIEKFITLSYE